MKAPGFVLVIDSYLLRKGLVSLLRRIQGVRVVKEFASIPPFEAYIQESGADFIIICEQLFDRAGDLYLSETDLLERTLILKDTPSEKPQKEKAASLYVSDGKETLAGKIHAMLSLHSGSYSRAQPEELTPREKEIVRHVSLGLTNREIADTLFLSTHTVITHRKNISSKLGIKSASGLTIYAIVNNIISLEDAAPEHPE